MPSPSVGQARQGSTSATPRSPRGLKCCRDLIDAAGRRRAVRVSSSDPPCPFRNACGVHPRKIRMASSIRSPILWRVSCVTASTAPYRGVSVSSSSSSSSSGSLIHFHLYHLQRFVTGGGRVSTHSLVSRDLALLGKPDESAGGIEKRPITEGKETYHRGVYTLNRNLTILLAAYGTLTSRQFCCTHTAYRLLKKKKHSRHPKRTNKQRTRVAHRMRILVQIVFLFI